MNCIDLMSKRSKQRKTTKAIKLRWIACILHQNEQKCRVRSQTIQKNATLQKWSKYNDLHRFDVKSDQITMNLHRFGVKTIYNVEVRRKTFKTTQNCKSNQITMNCVDLTSKWSKMLLRRKTFETTQNYKSDQIGRQNEQKWWVTSQNIHNYAKLQKWSNYNELHRFDVKTIKATQNSKRDQITMNLHRFDVKTI